MIRLRPRTTAALAVALALAFAARSARAVDYDFRGLLEVTAAERGPAYARNVLTRGDSPFDAYGARLFGDARVNERLAVTTQVVLRDASGLYVEGAYLIATPFPERDLHLLAGKVPWCVGTWAPRAYADKNPLLGAPLLYQYHSSLVWYAMPEDADALLSAAGSGQFAVDYQGYPLGRGMPLVDDSWWDVGVTLTGSARPFEGALGVGTGTPGWGNTSQDENSGKSVLGRIGLAPRPWVRFGVSGAYGPYLVRALGAGLPPGKEVGDFHQKLAMADLELLAGHVELRAEGARNFWETPTVGELATDALDVELAVKLPVGAFLAGRWDVLRFGDVTAGNGARRSWDSDVSRIETGAGYRFTRESLVKLAWQRTEIEGTPLRPSRHYALVAAQVVVSF